MEFAIGDQEKRVFGGKPCWGSAAVKHLTTYERELCFGAMIGQIWVCLLR